MESTKLEFALMPPLSAPSNSGHVGTLHGRHIIETLSGPSHLDQHSFVLGRSVGSIPLVHQQEDRNYTYSRRVATPLSSNQNGDAFQDAGDHRVDPYLYYSGFSQYFHHSQSHYHSSTDTEPFPVNTQAQFNTQHPPVEVESSHNLALSNGSTSSISPDVNALRRYHEAQGRQHAQVLQQLTQGCPSPTCSNIPRNTSFSVSFEEIVPVSDVGLYHTPSPIPMSNDQQQRLQQTPEITHRQFHHSLPSNHYQYPYHNDENFGRYHQKSSADNFNVSNTHLPTVPSVGAYEEPHHEPTTAFHTPNAAVIGPVASPTSAPPHSSLDILRSGVRSNTVQPPSSHLLARIASASKVSRSSDRLPDLAAIAVPSFSDMENRGDHDEVVNNQGLIEISRADEEVDEKVASDAKIERTNGPSRTIVVEEVVESQHSGVNSMKKQGKRKIADVSRSLDDSTIMGFSTNSALKESNEELPPPTKKRKKSKMHECEVCHKKFPRSVFRFLFLVFVFRDRDF